MKEHKIEILPPEHTPTVQVTSLAQLLKKQKVRIYVLKDTLAINHRTAQRRIQEPETMTVRELLLLGQALNVSEHQLLDLIRDEYRSRPSCPNRPKQKLQLTKLPLPKRRLKNPASHEAINRRIPK